MLDLALKIAVKAHAQQVDKAGEPYILHPIRLMQCFDDSDLRVVAVLHDVVEDSDTTLAMLADYGFKPSIIEAIANLTKTAGESYDAFIKRAASHELSRLVKIEDIKDNLNVLRLSQLTDKDLQRIKKYQSALTFLLNQPSAKV